MILDAYPTLPRLYIDIADLMCRVMHILVEPLYAPLRPFTPSWTVSSANNSVGMSTMEVVANTTVYKTFNWRNTPYFGTWTRRASRKNEGTYQFFYHLWKKDLEVFSCTSIQEVWTKIKPWMDTVGSRVSRDAILVTKLVRILHHGLSVIPVTSSDRPAFRDAVLRVIPDWFLGPICLMKCNTGLLKELFGLVSLFEVNERWGLYSFWGDGVYKGDEELRVVKMEATRHARSMIR